MEQLGGAHASAPDSADPPAARHISPIRLTSPTVLNTTNDVRAEASAHGCDALTRQSVELVGP
jgi:hypothetical protein